MAVLDSTRTGSVTHAQSIPLETADEQGRESPFVSMTSPADAKYREFLKRKKTEAAVSGFEVHGPSLNKMLFPFQRAIVEWALRRGKAAIFAECGLGKTPIQLEWAQHVHNKTAGDVLILAPLAVAQQTRREGEKFGIPVTVCRSQSDVRRGINVANYEMLQHFDPAKFIGVVLDESSILKNFMGATKQEIMHSFARTPYKLACTATPAPNDHLELGNHAQFLDVMPSNEMIMRWFVNDSMTAGNYRLKRHGEKDFWRWVSTWAVSLDKPSDLGYSDEGFNLPELNILSHIVEVDHSQGGGDSLIRGAALSATTMHTEMRLTASDRAKKVQEVVSATDGPWIVWCNTNYEADELAPLLPGAIEVRGSDSVKDKEQSIERFLNEGGTLLSKPSICGLGMNFQFCHNVAFVGLSYSYEMYYQAMRRCWRFGQEHPVNVHVVHAETEGNVLQTIQRKREDHERMKAAMNEVTRETWAMKSERKSLLEVPEEEITAGSDWEMRLGDSCESVKSIADDSIHFSVFSPPFSNLYIYSDSIADMGNSSDHEEFFSHFKFLISELLRVTVPGRLCAVHCKDLPLYKRRDGAAGLYDFPGEICRAFSDCGWTYHSRVTIWKDPVIEMQRTKNHGLLYKQLCKDSAASRQGMADYLLVFRKWNDAAEFPDPVNNNGKERFEPNSYIGEEPPSDFDDHRHYSIQVWQRYASPVWFDIHQARVLNYQIARENEDEKHICPLQLDVIERSIELWTNPGDIVLSPFAGIGSEGYCAIKSGRKFIGIELKRAYWEYAVRNLQLAEVERGQQSMDALFTEAA